jgi:hypothetical protein
LKRDGTPKTLRRRNRRVGKIGTKTVSDVKIKQLSKIAGAATFENVETFAKKTAAKTGISPIFPFIINVLYPNGTRGASGRTKILPLKRNLTRFAERKSRPFEGRR